MSLENQENRKTKHHIPHSGSDHLPDEVIERPIRETPNVPLESVAGRVPDSPYDGFESLPPTDRERMLFDQGKTDVRNSYLTDTQEHKKSKKGLIIGVSAVAASAIAAGGIWLGASVSAKQNEAAPAPEPTAEAPVVPGAPEPTVAPETTPPVIEESPSASKETQSSGEYTAAELMEMPLASYEKLPLDDRLVLVMDMLEYANEMNSGEFGEHWDGDTSDLYKYNPIDVASPDNTAKEVAMQDVYMQQLALSQEEEGGRGYFGPDNASKALSGAWSGDQSPRTMSGEDPAVGPGSISMYNDDKANFNRLDPVTTHSYAQDVHDVKLIEQNLVDRRDGGEIPTIKIEYKTSPLPETLGVYKKGSELLVQKEFLYYEFDYKGEPKGLWLAYDGVVWPDSSK